MERQPDFRLYLITDRRLFATEEQLVSAIEAALRAGAPAVQLREKDLAVRPLLRLAGIFRTLTAAHGARLFINDRLDVAMAVGADGVHLGASGIPPQAARRVAGPDMMIGVSTHSADEAERAQQEGADFVLLGPVYDTPSKRPFGPPLGTEALCAARERISIPLFAVGGMSRERIREVRIAGADGVAVISAILAAGNIETYTEECMRELQ